MIWTRGTLFAAATILLFLGLATVSLVWLQGIQTELHREMGESNLWAANQAERESLKFLVSLEPATTDPDVWPEVELQFELLYSRIALLADNPQHAFLSGIGEAGTIRQARAVVERLDAALQQEPADIALITGEAETLTVLARQLALATYMAERRNGIALRERQIGAMTLLRVAVIGGFMAGMVLASLLIRDKRKLLRLTEALKIQQVSLELTIAERTVELREALATERRAKEVYRSFVVTVAHQFRTPVSIIHLTAQRQVRSSDEDLAPPTRRRFARILDAAERLERLIGGFLETAAIEQRALVAHRTVIDFNAVAAVAATQIRSAHPDRRLDCLFTDERLQIDGDAVLLEQVVLNLLSNAVKYSPPGEIVELRTGREGDRILCTVRDRGCGIPQAALGSIFERYYRAPNTHHLPGVGVGLSLAAQIVGLHGGRIDVTSEEGRGTTFHVTLPATVGVAA